MPELPECRCNQCGHSWTPAVETPKVCPRCKSYDWDKPKKVKHD